MAKLLDMRVVVGATVLVAFIAVPALGHSCSRYGGGTCCTDLDPADVDILDSYEEQPFYFKMVPDTEDNRKIDNECVTFFPLPDDPTTSLYYRSTVFKDGSGNINTFIQSQPEIGVRRLGKALCSRSETLFAEVDHTNVDPACSLFLYYSCNLRGDCPVDITNDSQVPVYALSTIRRPISRSCLNSVKSDIRNNGLPDQDYLILPMKLPTRCVFNQVCTIQPVLQRFRQAFGVAFPSLAY